MTVSQLLIGRSMQRSLSSASDWLTLARCETHQSRQNSQPLIAIFLLSSALFLTSQSGTRVSEPSDSSHAATD